MDKFQAIVLSQRSPSQRLHIIKIHLYGAPEKAKLQSKIDQWLPNDTKDESLSTKVTELFLSCDDSYKNLHVLKITQIYIKKV